MTHPEELLAGYVDGSLDQSERMIVAEHLSGCGLCREEVALAGRARTKLRAVPEEPAPAQITQVVTRAMAEGAPAETAGGRAPARYRVLTALAAAAVVALIAVALHLGGSGRGTKQLAADGGAAQSTGKQMTVPQAPNGALRLEIQGNDYTAASAAKLIQRSPNPSPGSPNPSPGSPNPSPVEASNGYFGAGSPSFGTDAAGRSALSCLQTAFQGIPGEPVRLIQATFQGQPAYIGIYTEGPGAGLPADTVTVRVASKASCTVLTFASYKL